LKAIISRQTKHIECLCMRFAKSHKRFTAEPRIAANDDPCLRPSRPDTGMEKGKKLARPPAPS
jgi:hypothetical protein